MRALSRPLGPQSGYDPSPKGADDIGHPLSQCGIQHGSRTGTHTQVRQREPRGQAIRFVGHS